jgi:hypothetical protein
VPGQIFLDPRNPTTTGRWSPPATIPPSLREFGRFPDVSKWLPGDLLLFSAINPGRISQSLIKGQERGGHAPEDARWHHAAVYLGDGINICEAVPRKGVRYTPIYQYIGGYLLRIRRDPTLTPDQRWQIAMQSLTRLGSSYGFRRILSLTRQSWQGYWQPDNRLPLLVVVRTLICSQLFSDSYSMVTGRLLVQQPHGIVKPADLSFALQLTDVETTWLRI